MWNISIMDAFFFMGFKEKIKSFILLDGFKISPNCVTFSKHSVVKSFLETNWTPDAFFVEYHFRDEIIFAIRYVIETFRDVITAARVEYRIDIERVVPIFQSRVTTDRNVRKSKRNVCVN